MGVVCKAFQILLRRGGIYMLGAGLLGLGGMTSGCSSGQSESEVRNQHNVVLISIDTLRADHLSCYGYERETSPNIDRFAEEALVFANAYSVAPMTIASHMSMFTSVIPSVHGVAFSDDGTHGVLPETITTLPEILQENGFTNYGYINETIHLDAGHGFGRGFPDILDRREDRRAGYYGNRKFHLFSEHRYELREEEPFFIFFHTFNAHCSNLDPNANWFKYIYDGPPKFRDRFLPDGKEKPFDRSRVDVYMGMEKIPPDVLEEVAARYDGGILHVDSEIAELFSMLKEENLYDNSLIILTADHGECLGDREAVGVPLFWGHGGLYKVGLHVPLIIKFPKGFKYDGPLKGVVDHYVRTVDIFPTVLESLAIETPSYIEGESLLRVNRDKPCLGQTGDRYSYSTREYRVIFKSPPDLSEIKKVEIYDVRNDPAELNNLFREGDAKSADILELAKETHKRNIFRRQDLLSDSKQKVKELSEREKKGLKAFGYLE
jgi:arylsulfatase A-like enzyme